MRNFYLKFEFVVHNCHQVMVNRINFRDVWLLILIFFLKFTLKSLKFFTFYLIKYFIKLITKTIVPRPMMDYARPKFFIFL